MLNRILDKWQSTLLKIKTNYKKYEGKHQKQVDFEYLIRNEKKRFREELENEADDEDVNAAKRQRKAENDGVLTGVKKLNKLIIHEDKEKGTGQSLKKPDVFKKMMNNLKKGKKIKR